MAKSQRRPIDMLERKARLEPVHRQRDLEERQYRNMHRMGWLQTNDEADECEDQSDLN